MTVCEFLDYILTYPIFGIEAWKYFLIAFLGGVVSLYIFNSTEKG